MRENPIWKERMIVNRELVNRTRESVRIRTWITTYHERARGAPDRRQAFLVVDGDSVDVEHHGSRVEGYDEMCPDGRADIGAQNGRVAVRAQIGELGPLD